MEVYPLPLQLKFESTKSSVLEEKNIYTNLENRQHGRDIPPKTDESSVAHESCHHLFFACPSN